MLQEQIFDGLSAILRRYVNCDPDIATKVAPLQGKVVCVTVMPLAIDIYLLADASGLSLRKTVEVAPDVTLRGTPVAFLCAYRAALNGVSSLEDIEVNGDATVAGDFTRVFKDIDIDWEEQFSQIIGDAPAYQLFRLGKSFLRRIVYFKESCTNSVDEYIHEEVRLLPPRREIVDFMNDISVIRDDVERAQLRLARLLAAVATMEGTSTC